MTAFKQFFAVSCRRLQRYKSLAGAGMMWGRETAQQMLREAAFTRVEICEPEFDSFNDAYLCWA